MKRRLRTTLTPGSSIGTMTHECRPVRGASGRDTPITITKAQSGCAPPVMYHLRPFTTQSGPSRRRLVAILVASEEATSGSVMPKADRVRPSSRGSSQRFFCAEVAACCSMIMLGTSGAWQLKTSGAHGSRPVISAIGA